MDTTITSLEVFDLVHIKKDLPSYMDHFEKDTDAIVTYCDADNYTLYIKGRGETSWYNSDNVIFIKHDAKDVLEAWKKEIEIEQIQKSDLDWIFSHGEEVIKNPSGYSLQALATSIGLGSLWGNNGEGITYYTRSMQIYQLAKPFLIAGNKEGWLSLKSLEEK